MSSPSAVTLQCYLLNGACVARLEGSAFEIMSLRERDKFGRITWEKLSESVRFAHIASVTRPQDA